MWSKYTASCDLASQGPSVGCRSWECFSPTVSCLEPICALPIWAVGHSCSTTACVMRCRETKTHLVSHLMCNDVSHAPEVWQAGMLGVYQQGCFSVGDESPVLHSPSSKIRDANQVQLWQREWDSKQGLKSW